MNSTTKSCVRSLRLLTATPTLKLQTIIMTEKSSNSRVCTTKQELEKLIMDITCHDLNLQMQQLISDYKKTGNEHYKLDAEYLRAEFETWWNDEVSLFAPPAEA